MKRSQHDKEETHKKIVEKAGQQMRSEGTNRVGIAELMGLAGLTHGGFYAHFRNKDALIAEVCREGLANTLAQFLQIIADAPEGTEVAAVVDKYLSLSHRDHPDLGCVMPSLAADIARRPEEVREAFTQGYEEMQQSIAPFLSKDVCQDQRDAAIVLLSGMVGALLLARTVNNPVLSEHILHVNQDFYAQTFSNERE